MALNKPNCQIVPKKAISVYRLSDPQPDWEETDPSQPDYIKNKEEAEKYRSIQVNGVDFLDESYESGKVNFVSGNNISLKAEGNNIIISAKQTTSDGNGNIVYEGTEYIEGTGIDITDAEDGQKVISLEPGGIPEDYLPPIPLSKLVQDNEITIILSGGNANGN